jgi:hypothetical protein
MMPLKPILRELTGIVLKVHVCPAYKTLFFILDY